MDLTADFFSLFDLPRLFAIDLSELEHRYREVQGLVHPDKFAGRSDAERRQSMQWATRANEGFMTLKKPLERAKYLLVLAGHDVQAESNTAMPTDFLIEQMEWREAVGEAKAGGDHHELEHLHHRLSQDMAARYAELTELFDQQSDFVAATDRVRRLMFLEKLLQEIDDALASLEE